MDMVRSLLRWIRVIRSGVDDPEKFHIQQIEYLGKVVDTLMIFPYGLHGNVPPDAFGIMFSVQGNPDNRGVIAWVPKGRPHLEAGEVAFYHPPTDAFMIWKANGDLDIVTGNNGIGKINITASAVTINAATTTINGDLIVNGDTLLDDIVTSDGVNISNTHIHSQGNDSDGDSEADTGVPHS